MENNNSDENQRRLRSGKILSCSNDNDEPHEFDIEIHSNIRKRNHPKNTKTDNKKIKSKKTKKNKLAYVSSLNDTISSIDVQNESQDTGNSTTSPGTPQMTGVASPCREEGFFSLSPLSITTKQASQSGSLQPSPTTKNEQDGLRVTPDFDITTTDAEILETICGIRNAPPRKAPSGKVKTKGKISSGRGLFRYLSKPFRLPSFMSFKRDSGVGESPQQ